MPSRAHYRARVSATLGAAATHAFLCVLAAVDLLNYTVPTQYEVLAHIAAEDYWAWIHAGCAVVLCLSLINPGKHIRIRSWTSELPAAAVACNIGFTMMFCWAFFNMVWGLSAERPVSLAGPGLAFAVAFGELILASSWTRGTYDRSR